MRIAVDLDGVCYEFDRTARYMLREYRGVKVEGVTDKWDYLKDHCSRDDWRWLWSEGVTKGLFRYGHMVAGARIGLEQLVADGHSLKVVTHRPASATPDTVQWLALYFNGLSYTFNMLSDGESKTSVEWDLLVDDKPENITDALDAGRRAIMYAQPWNDDNPYASARDWKEVTACVRSLRTAGYR